MDAVKKSENSRLLVLIDEYDRFANKLMLENIAAYHGVVTGVSGDPLPSPIRAFYETIKEGVPGMKDYRSITFGIAPIALADASGANNIDPLSMKLLWVHTKRSFKGTRGNWSSRSRTKSYYNGYHFHERVPVENMLYNTSLTLSFMRKYQKDKKFREIVQNWKETNPEVLVRKLRDNNAQRGVGLVV